MNVKTLFLALLILGTLLPISCNNETSKPETAVILVAKTELNVAYGSDEQQTMDIYLPANRSASTTKTVVIIHGGGWTSGDKNDVNGLVGLIQRALPDHAVINMNYRLANGTNRKAFPDQLEDIKSVINKLVANKSEYGINGTFALYGISAGAHIATLYAYTQNEGDRIKAVINMVGPVDFTDPYFANNTSYQAVLASFIDTSEYPAGFNAATTLSPATQVTATSPPTINFYGNADPLVPLTQLTRFEAALSAKNVTYESTIYDGGHGNWSAVQYSDLQTKVKAFIEAHY
ncbi:MAG: alpha/beta hydrolase [Nonlabens sp.]|nr:alpha/beta hydrolase [Nonlabens sp.]